MQWRCEMKEAMKARARRSVDVAMLRIVIFWRHFCAGTMDSPEKVLEISTMERNVDLFVSVFLSHFDLPGGDGGKPTIQHRVP
jgi:hypothetical protein